MDPENGYAILVICAYVAKFGINWRLEMKEMKEIDLKKTPLSEIDLSNVDYEKSYIMIESVKQKSSRKYSKR